MRIAKIVDLKELRGYFGPGKVWRRQKWTDGGVFEGETKQFVVDLWPVSPTYKVHIEAVDDSSDSEDIVTEKPVEAIVEFLGKNLPGGEYFESMASSPTDFVSALRMAASGSVTSSAIRRFIVALELVSDASPSSSESLEDISKHMKSKGWKSSMDADGRGAPVLRIDISGVYEATVQFESHKWGYEFSLRGIPDVKTSGVTDDPISEFQKFYRSDAVSNHTMDVEPDQIILDGASGTIDYDAPTAPPPGKEAPTVAPGKKASIFKKPYVDTLCEDIRSTVLSLK